MKIHSFLLFLITVLTISSCDLLSTGFDSDCRENSSPHDFILPFEILNRQDSYKIGDEFCLSFDFSDEILDINRNERFKLENWTDFSAFITISKFDNGVKSVDFKNFIDTVSCFAEKYRISFHEFYEYTNTLPFQFKYKDESYKASFCFRLKEKGIYLIQIITVSDEDANSGFDFSGRCNGKAISYMYSLDPPGNYDLVKWLLYPKGDPGFVDGEVSKDYFKKKGSFSFVVN